MPKQELKVEGETNVHFWLFFPAFSLPQHIHSLLISAKNEENIVCTSGSNTIAEISHGFS